MKFKVGQKVRCNDKGGSMRGDGWILNNVFKIERLEDAGDGCSVANKYYDKGGGFVYEDCLELVNKTIEDVDYPDIIESGNYKRKVLGRINDLAFVSIANDFDITGGHYTISELKKYNFKIVQEEDKEVEDAIKVLEKAGKLKDGKILED